MEVVKGALTFYLAVHDHLPCPDVLVSLPPDPLDGFEDKTGTTCTAPVGVLPYQTLGLSREAALDGWDNFISYHVASSPVNWSQPQAFKLTDTGDLTVNTDVGSQAGLVAVLVSHGRNGLGAYTIKGTQLSPPAVGSDEDENTDLDTFYVTRTFTENESATGGAFDDVVLPISAGQLLSPQFLQGQLKIRLLDEAFRSGEALVFARTVESSCIVPSSTTMMISDPWGNDLVYTRLVSALISIASPPSSVQVATLTSSGPDGTVGTSDDKVFYVTSDRLAAFAVISNACP